MFSSLFEKITKFCTTHFEECKEKSVLKKAAKIIPVKIFISMAKF